ncbi:MAG: UDP-3-O-(3-hydroxymyristoyl)glucosamine N-acyltransferase [Candidatus Omnitrophica bacterium]|nr:UDP-3-O-(3-hydroxymyristoyl)glucosamine N-acyltransferase [Candidatus Omnitrophota bacterium]
MQKTLAEIAQLIDGKVLGDEKVFVTGISGIKEAREGDITFVADPKYFPLIEETKASAIIVSENILSTKKNLICTKDPSFAFSKLAVSVVGDLSHHIQGIHPTAVIADDAVIGKNVCIGPHAVIQSKVEVGDNSIVYSGCFIGYETKIGTKCLIYPNVTIRERAMIGNNVIIHSGTVIGSDGFGFNEVGGAHEKIPQIGTVVIEDDVEIGSNVTVDRARFDKTFIGKGTKIDNLVQIAHNVTIGRHCIIISQTGISGSVQLGDRVTIAGQVGIAGHLTIGEGTIVAARSGVTKSIAPKMIVSGFPAKPHDKAKRINAAVQRLPEYVKTINDLKKRIEILEQNQK